MNNLKVFLLSFALMFAFGLVLAQEANESTGVIEEVEETVMEAVNLDEDIQPEDLEVSEPKLLPDSPFYFLKNWGRAIQSFFTFNPVAKIRLKEKFTNEKLIELKKLIEKERDRETIENAIRNYQNEVGEIERAIERIREKAEENEEVGKFLDKFIQHQALHQRVLQKLEEQVPAEVFEKIKEARERHLEIFGEVMNRLEENKEKLQERLEKNLKEIKGSEFKEFKNLEVLKNLEEKVPEEAKEAIQGAQEIFLLRLKEKLEQLPLETQEKFKEYIEKISGDKEGHIEILENLKEELKNFQAIQEKILESRERLLEQVRERIQEKECPEIEKPVAGFCQEGRITIKKDEEGCIVEFKCVIPAEIEIPSKPEQPAACITLWDPVCGKDGKTYSNACFAKLAGVEIDYKGECKEKECQTDADCPQLRCGPVGTISARCIGVKVKCIEGKCQVISTALPLETK